MRLLLGCGVVLQEKQARGPYVRLGKRWQLPLLCLLAAIGVVALVLMTRHLDGALVWLRAEHLEVHREAARLGAFAPLAFLIAFALAMLLVWFPTVPWIIVGGFLFGPVSGTILSLIAETLGAMMVFTLAKSGLAHRMPKQHRLLRLLEEGFRRDALEYVIFLRIMPVMPFGIIHVAAAAFDISLRVFTIGTFVGMVPFTIIYSLLGADVDRIIANGNPLDARLLANPSVGAPLFALAALALVPLIVRQVRRRFGRGAKSWETS